MKSFIQSHQSVCRFSLVEISSIDFLYSCFSQSKVNTFRTCMIETHLHRYVNFLVSNWIKLLISLNEAMTYTNEQSITDCTLVVLFRLIAIFLSRIFSPLRSLKYADANSHLSVSPSSSLTSFYCTSMARDPVRYFISHSRPQCVFQCFIYDVTHPLSFLYLDWRSGCPDWPSRFANCLS